MQVKQEDTKFVLYDGDQQIGYLAFSYQGDHLISADHTEVDDKYQSQGLAQQLLDNLVNFAKENDYKIIAKCSYVAKKFHDQPEKYQDIKAD